MASQLGSISPIFYGFFFIKKSFEQLFVYLHFGFVFFRQKNIGAKAAPKMLVKLTPGCLDLSDTEARTVCVLTDYNIS